MSNPNKILLDKPKAEEEEREEEEEMIVKSMLDERGEELVEVERLEMLEKEEEAEGQGEEEEQKATKTTEKDRNEQMDNGNTEGGQVRGKLQIQKRINQSITKSGKAIEGHFAQKQKGRCRKGRKS